MDKLDDFGGQLQSQTGLTRKYGVVYSKTLVLEQTDPVVAANLFTLFSLLSISSLCLPVLLIPLLI